MPCLRQKSREICCVGQSVLNKTYKRCYCLQSPRTCSLCRFVVVLIIIHFTHNVKKSHVIFFKLHGFFCFTILKNLSFFKFNRQIDKLKYIQIVNTCAILPKYYLPLASFWLLITFILVNSSRSCSSSVCAIKLIFSLRRGITMFSSILVRLCVFLIAFARR